MSNFAPLAPPPPAPQLDPATVERLRAVLQARQAGAPTLAGFGVPGQPGAVASPPVAPQGTPPPPRQAPPQPKLTPEQQQMAETSMELFDPDRGNLVWVKKEDAAKAPGGTTINYTRIPKQYRDQLEGDIYKDKVKEGYVPVGWQNIDKLSPAAKALLMRLLLEAAQEQSKREAK